MIDADAYLLTNKCYKSGTMTHVVSRKTWHTRLGNVFFNKLEKLKNVLHFGNSGDDSYCSVFPLAKQKRLLFVSHNHVSQNDFDLVHCDT